VDRLINLAGEQFAACKRRWPFGAKVARMGNAWRCIPGIGVQSHAEKRSFTCPAKDCMPTLHVRHAAHRVGVTRHVTNGAAVWMAETGVFQGKFFVPRKTGQHTDADMQHPGPAAGRPAPVVFAKPELKFMPMMSSAPMATPALSGRAQMFLPGVSAAFPRRTSRAPLADWRTFIAEGTEHG